MERTPIVIINGFLGSGKTTLLRDLLGQAYQKKLAVSVIVNDMSELDVDGILIGDMDMMEEKFHQFSSIYADSISSKSGIKKLHETLSEMLTKQHSDLIIIETSGSSHPLPLIEYFQAEPQLMLIGMLALVDSRMLDTDYDRGEQLISQFQQNLQTSKRNTVNLLVEQILFCSHLFLTKADLIADGKLEMIAQAIHPINPYVPITSVSFGNFSIEDLLLMPEYDYHRIAQLSEELKPIINSKPTDSFPYNLSTSVLRDDRAFHPQRLWDTYHKYLGQQIYRSKGFFWLPTRNKLALLWNQSCGNISLEIIGYWRSGILEDKGNRLFEMEQSLLKEKIAQDAGRFGDRHCELTIIGDKSQIEQFTNALRQCFLTEKEIKQWQAGETFIDPWPK